MHVALKPYIHISKGFFSSLLSKKGQNKKKKKKLLTFLLLQFVHSLTASFRYMWHFVIYPKRNEKKKKMPTMNVNSECVLLQEQKTYYFVNNLLECDDDHCFCHHLFYVQSALCAPHSTQRDEFSKVFFASFSSTILCILYMGVKWYDGVWPFLLIYFYVCYAFVKCNQCIYSQ